MKIITLLISILVIFGAASVTYYSLRAADTTSSARYTDIESYVRAHINDIAPIKATMGGSFYVTSFQTRGSTGTMSFEDGHNAYKADFTYAVDQEGKPMVGSISLRE